MGVGCFEQKRRVGRQGKRLFYFGDFSRYSPGGAGRRLYTPPVETPATAHPDKLHTTGGRAGRARYRADRTRHDTHARTLDTLHRSALDTKQAARGRSYRRRDAGGCAVCPAKCTISDVQFYPYLYGYVLPKALTIHIYMDII